MHAPGHESQCRNHTKDACVKTDITIDAMPAGDGSLYQAAAASLWEVHRRGIVHNDLHESNFLVIEGGQAPARVVVLDFSCALFTRDEALISSEQQELSQLFSRLG